jgi:chromosome segregation ATPase
MAEGFKEYKSVSEFPLQTQELTREELEQAYQEIRKEYRNLSTSRGQLVRRQTEAKVKVRELKTSLVQVNAALDSLNSDKNKLQQSLSHSVRLGGELQEEKKALSSQVTNLRAQLNATTKLLDDFESVYEEVKDQKGVGGFFRLLQAAKRLFTTDISELMMKRAEIVEEDWTKEDQASINRNLLDR